MAWLRFFFAFAAFAVFPLSNSFSLASLELVTEGLPEIEDLLAELELSELAPKFYASGFTETKYILRMKDMDLRIMAMEWGVEKEKIMRVREAIRNYKVEREVVKVVEDPLITLRNSLTYGKMVVSRSTTSYDYYTAFFSAAMPREPMKLFIAGDPAHTGCSIPSNTGSLIGKVLVAHRGNCSFLEKATNASAANASALVIVNNGSDLFQIPAGYATGSSHDESTGVPQDLPVIMIKGHAMKALQLGGGEIEARMIPLRCPSGESTCTAVLPEEQEQYIPYEIDSGFLEFRLSKLEFVSGTWGGILPYGTHRVTVAYPRDACSPLTNAADANGAFVISWRGACGFGDKVLHAQQAGAVAVVIVDRPDSALLRIGVTQEQALEIGIPGMMISHKSGEIVLREMPSVASISPLGGMSKFWLELAVVQWPKEESAFDVMLHQLKQRNAGSTERLNWLTEERNRRHTKKQNSDEL